MRNGKNNTYKIPRTTWIVPIQTVGPIQFKFYNLLIANSHRIISLATIATHNLEFGKIIKCKGKTKNDSGLVLKAKIGSLSFLLPGDASYDEIPILPNEQYNGIVASHHGGKCTNNLPDFPQPMIPDNGMIIYSLGRCNTYHHPNLSSVAKHGRVGWLNIESTPKSVFVIN